LPVNKILQKIGPHVKNEPTKEEWELSKWNLKIHSLFAKRTLRSWRTAGAGIGVFREFHLFYGSKGINNYKGRLFPFKYSIKNLNSPGMKPYRIYSLRGGRRNPDQITEYGRIFSENNQPILSYIGGETGRFTSKDHSFFSEEPINKQIIIINDSLIKLPVQIDLKLCESNGTLIEEFSLRRTIDIGERQKIPFSFTAPTVSEQKDYSLGLNITQGNKTLSEDNFSIQIFPKQSLSIADKYVLYDEKGLTASLLKKAGIHFKFLQKDMDMTSLNTIIIGRESLTNECSHLLANLRIDKWLNSGGVLIIFEQKDLVHLGLKLKETRVRDTYIQIKRHPLVSGLNQVDFKNWRFSSDIMHEYPEPNPEEEQNQSIVFDFWRKNGFWKAGNTGVVGTFSIEEPHFGSYRSIVHSGFDMKDSQLLEIFCNKGRIIVCQLDVTHRYKKDPVATKIVNNLLKYAIEAEQQEWHEAIILSENKINSLQKLMALKASVKKDLQKIPTDIENIIIESGYKISKMEFDTLNHFVAEGGRLLWFVDNRMQNSLLPVKTYSGSLFKVIPNIDDPLLCGVGIEDFYWRNEQKILVFKCSKTESITDPPVLCRIKKGKGEIILCSVIPDNFKPKDFESYGQSRLYVKAMELISNIFTNSGVYCHLPYDKRLLVNNQSGVSPFPYLQITNYNPDMYHSW